MLAFVLRLGSAAPLGLNKCIPIINPGLAPWAMQVYRPYRAPLRLPYHFIILMRLLWVKETDRLTGIKMLLSLRSLLVALTAQVSR